MSNPAWLDTLDDEGRTFYNNYVTATKKWVQYIKPKATTKFNTYLNTTKKIYDKHEYVNFLYQTNHANYIQDTTTSPTPGQQSKDLTAKYKKLSLLFHPDKYNNPNNSKFFMLIKKFYNDNNEYIINTIDTISHIILDTPDISNLITNLENPNITQLLQSHLPIPTHQDIFTILNTTDITMQPSNTPDSMATATSDDLIDKDLEFLVSSEYGFYQQKQEYQKLIDAKYITEAEFIKIIHDTPHYNQDFIMYCHNLYSHVPAILAAITDWQRRDNERLKKEIEELEKIKKMQQETINTLNKLKSTTSITTTTI